MTDDDMKVPNDDFGCLNREEGLQFQHFMMQKTLKKFGYTEVMLLNDLIVAYNDAMDILSEVLDEEEFLEFSKSADGDILRMFEVLNYYNSLLAEEENNYPEDFPYE